MARSIWKGSISFGLVNTPIAVYPATRAEKVSFKQLRKKDLNPIRYKKVAKAEGVAVNQLINVAVAEKVSALRTEEYFAERAAKGDIKKALQVLKRSGKGNRPISGDELPQKSTRRRSTPAPPRPRRGSSSRAARSYG